MCQGLWKLVALAAIVVVRGSERLPSTSRKLDESVCFDLVLEDDAGNDRDGTMYTITTLTDGEVVAVGNMRSNSTRNSGSPRLQTDRVCVEEAPVCLRIVVAEGVAWSAGGVASGPAGVNGDFAVLDGGEIAEDDELCATADSSTSNCFLFEMTSSSGEGWKGGYYRITNVNGKTLTIDTTSAEVSTETHAVCVTEAPACYTVDVVAGLDNQIGWTLGGVLTGVAPDPGQSFNVLPGGTVVEATCTFSPTLSPTHSLSPTLTHAPSILASSFEQPISTFASLSLAMTLLERGRKEAFEIVVEGTIVFENEIEIEDNAVDIRGVGKVNGSAAQPPYAVFDGDHRTRMFTVRDSAVLSLSDLILRNALVDAASSGGVIDVSGSEVYLYRCVFAYNHGGRGGAISASDSVVNAVNTTFSNNTAERSGAAAYVAFASEMNVVDSVFDSNYAAIAGAAFLVDQSALSVRTSSFNSNVAWFGGTIAASTASLDFDSCTFVSNRANERGGVVGMSTTSLKVANCSYDANSAALTSAVFHSWVSAVNIEASTFTSNTAGSHAGVSESFSSEVSIVGCAFHSNSAVEEGGVFRASSSQVHVEESTFDSNSASTGGALYVEESSTFDIVGSNFSSNSAIVGGAIRVTHGSLLQLQGIALDSSSAADNASHFLSCQTSSTIYAALTMLDSSQKFDLAETCVMYFYLANNDGSNDFKIDTLQAVIGETGTIDLRHWTYPCTAGKYSSDGLEHGDTAAYEDRNGQTIDFNDPNCEPDAPPSSPLSCSASCAPCPSGTYSEFTMDRYSLVGATSCSNCPVGRYLSDDGVDASKHDSQDDCEACPPGRFGDEVGASACKLCAEGKYSSEPESIFCVSAEPGYFVSGSGSSVHLPCPAGRYSVGEAGFCDACPPGTYQSRSGQTTCSLARPGYFVNQSEGIDEKPCPPGSISAGSGSERCTRCKPGEYQPNPGRSSCLLARPGSFVQNVAASEQEACEAGTFSASGAANCSECEIGRYNSDDMNADCRTCPTPMNTTRAGSTYCDACSSGFYFDTMHWENKGQFEWNTSGTHCVDCCVECDEDGMVCDQSGVELLSLVVESGWWRATSRSKEVYECDFRKACKGGNLTESDEQCSNGHKGARCGACEKDFVYSPIKQRCVKCGNKVQIISSAASILVFFLLTGVLVFSWLRRFGSRYHWHTITRVVSMVARDEMSSGAETGSELFSDRGGRNASRENEDDEDEDQKRDQLLRSVLTKLKIVSVFFDNRFISLSNMT